jgi:hypothetical protein
MATITMSDFGYVGNDGAKNLYDAEFHNIVKSFWGLEGQAVSISPSILKLDGTASDEAPNNTCTFIKGSAGVGINKSEDASLAEPTGASGYVIYIDTNGWGTKPNVTGKDIFSFKMQNDGKLIPNIGSADSPIESGAKAQEIIEAGFRINYY